MKMKLFDRILLAVYALIILVACVALAFVVFNATPAENITAAISNITQAWQLQAAVGIVLALLILASLRLLFLRGDRRSSERDLILKTTDHGVIRISLFTIDSLAQKHARSVSYVRDVKSQVIIYKETVRIRLKLSLMPETDIPKVTTQLQQSVKEYVEQYAGIFVQEVQIFVEDTSLNLKARVD
ncbi:MAG: alkaline shock response membrane anchor protein AmaP [Christensenellales bacterium]|jgi:uncharacterized alkaline shock family protein YloU